MALINHFADEIIKWRSVAVICFAQRGKIMCPHEQRNDGNHIALLQQCKVHEQAGGATVTVNKRVNIDKALVQPCSKSNRMHAAALDGNLVNKGAHEVWHSSLGNEATQGVGGRMSGLETMCVVFVIMAHIKKMITHKFFCAKRYPRSS